MCTPGQEPRKEELERWNNYMRGPIALLMKGVLAPQRKFRHTTDTPVCMVWDAAPAPTSSSQPPPVRQEAIPEMPGHYMEAVVGRQRPLLMACRLSGLLPMDATAL